MSSPIYIEFTHHALERFVQRFGDGDLTIEEAHRILLKESLAARHIEDALLRGEVWRYRIDVLECDMLLARNHPWKPRPWVCVTILAHEESAESTWFQDLKRWTDAAFKTRIRWKRSR